MEPARSADAQDAVRFPKILAAIQWLIIGSLTLLAVLAAAFWVLVLGGFAGSGFHAPGLAGRAAENVVITPECAWPYRVNDPDAGAVCRMYYNLTPQQRAQVLKSRK